MTFGSLIIYLFLEPELLDYVCLITDLTNDKFLENIHYQRKGNIKVKIWYFPITNMAFYYI